MDIVRIRASSLASLFDCPKRFEATQINKITMPRNPKNLIGNAVHHACAAFDANKLEGNPILINDAAELSNEYINKVKDEVDWGDTDLKSTCSKAKQLVQKYCVNIAPMYEFVMVEPEDLRPIEIDIEGITLIFTGTPDRAYITIDGLYGGADLKTGVSVVNAADQIETVKHIAQAAIYTMLIEENFDIQLTEPFHILGMSTAGTEPRTGIGIMTTNFKEYLFGNPEDENLEGIIHIAARLLKAGIFYGNPRSMMCHKQYCPIYRTCKFKG